MSTRSEAENAARDIRNRWGLGTRPIPDIFNVISARPEYVLVRRRGDKDGVDGIYARDPSTGRHFIYINRTKLVYRQRFTAAHEIGHSIREAAEAVDTNVYGESNEEEVFANYFASALLMPEADVRECLRSTKQPLDRNVVFMLAKRYGTSFPATVNRLNTLGCLSNDEKTEYLADPRRGVLTPPQREADIITSPIDGYPDDYVHAVLSATERGAMTHEAAREALDLDLDEAAEVLPPKAASRRRKRPDVQGLL